MSYVPCSLCVPGAAQLPQPGGQHVRLNMSYCMSPVPCVPDVAQLPQPGGQHVRLNMSYVPVPCVPDVAQLPQPGGQHVRLNMSYVPCSLCSRCRTTTPTWGTTCSTYNMSYVPVPCVAGAAQLPQPGGQHVRLTT